MTEGGLGGGCWPLRMNFHHIHIIHNQDSESCCDDLQYYIHGCTRKLRCCAASADVDVIQNECLRMTHAAAVSDPSLVCGLIGHGGMDIIAQRR